jgi:isoquinoline 1-oxidoreductase subunit beta
MGVMKLARRTLLTGAGAIAGGLAVGYYYVRRPFPNPFETETREEEAVFNPYVKIATDNSITIVVPRAEMGQGVHTTLAALVAEELEISPGRIEVEYSLAGSAYFNSAVVEEQLIFSFFDESIVAGMMRSGTYPLMKLAGIQATGGSSSVRDAFVRMREAGAAARQMLLQAAAGRWDIPADRLQAVDGTISDPQSGRSATYGMLALEAAELPPPATAPLKEKRYWKLLGKPLARFDVPAKVTGLAQFGMDIDLPNMVYGTVRINPHFGAGVRKVNGEKALAVKNVLEIVDIDLPIGKGVGVIAENSWAAFKGAEALEIEWEKPAEPFSTENLVARLAERLGSAPDFSLRNDGNVTREFNEAPAEEIVEAQYSVPWLAHACMEPMNATARWRDGFLDIWAPNQIPTLIQMNAGPLLGLKPEAVRVHSTYIGSSFGRRLEIDYALYAAEMARHVYGRPIKVAWTREEDMRHDAYRPAALARMRARVRRRELPRAVDISVASQSVAKDYLSRVFPSLPFIGPDKLVTEGAHDQPYAIDNYRVSGHVAELPVPVGMWRSVGNSYNGFFHESFIDEIAYASGIDPLGMRLRLMSGYPAAIGVLQKVSEMSGWGRDVHEGTGLGLAFTLSFGAWTAQVVEVTDTQDGISIDRVWCAVEIGQALDPAIVKSQFISAIIFGLSSAMGQQITFADGAVVESNFPEFDAMRMNQCPEIEVEILETYHKMGGAGEPGTPPSIPALGNAIFAATGKRLRKLPFSSEIDFV